MQEFLLSIRVTTRQRTTPAEVAALVGRLIDVGVSDAHATIDAGEGDIERAERVLCLDIGEPQTNAVAWLQDKARHATVIAMEPQVLDALRRAVAFISEFEGSEETALVRFVRDAIQNAIATGITIAEERVTIARELETVKRLLADLVSAADVAQALYSERREFDPLREQIRRVLASGLLAAG